MNTEIEFLKQLETDLEDAASRETARLGARDAPGCHPAEHRPQDG